MAESLGGEQAPVGLEADLPQFGQVSQSFADREVAGVVDRGFGSDRSLQLVSSAACALDGGASMALAGAEMFRASPRAESPARMRERPVRGAPRRL